MKLTDWVVEKFGQDKIMHFLGGGLICSMVTFVFLIQEIGNTFTEPWRILLFPIPGILFTGFLGWAKEQIFDKEFDIKDLWATLLGCVPVWLSIAIGILLK